MADRRDSWLRERVDPLPPPPGTFELIKRRARRRKYRKLALTAGAAAVIVAAAVTVPRVVNRPLLSPATSGISAGHQSPAFPASAASLAGRAVPSPAAPAPPVPADFRPSSVTFVGTGAGFVVGQALTPGHCATQYCTSVARTDNAGRTWTGVPAPLAGAADGAAGVSQIRFLDTSDGWAFGPELFATHDGGQTWTAVDTHGQRVTDLETVGDRAFALFASCTGGGPAFAAGCTSFTLYSSPAASPAASSPASSPASSSASSPASSSASSSAAGSSTWTPVGPSTSGLAGGAASVVLTVTRGYLLAPDGTLYAGPVDGGAAWMTVGRLPCQVGSAQPDGQPTGALLTAVNATDLVFACTPPPVPGGLQKKVIFTSGDGGSSWQQVAVAPAAGAATSMAATPAGTVVLATSQGIDLLPAGSTRWRLASVTGVPAGGFGLVGMTTDDQGVALPANPAGGTVWFTFDGGQSWRPSAVSGS